MLNIKIIEDKNLWEDFVTKQNPTIFVQSYQWGEFSTHIKGKPFYIGIFDDENLVGTCLAILYITKIGKYISVGAGPLINWENSEHFDLLVTFLEDLGRKEKASFIRIRPLILNTEENINTFKRKGFINSPVHLYAETTWRLDITPDEETILKGMRSTTRNLIRRCSKENITIEQTKNIEDIYLFDQIQQDTVKKHHFTPFNLNYTLNQFKAFEADNNIAIFKGIYNNKPISSAIVMYYGNMGYYHHGASLLEYAKLPASYGIQWEAILEAKRRGKDFYDFWGFTEDPSHPWYGPSMFKKGFGGFRVDYMHCMDKPISMKYIISSTYEKLRARKRKLKR